MSHPGARLSALVDGELGHDERDRVLAHLAHCGECRAEATALRRLKQRIRDLEDEAAGAELARRLVALAEPGDPATPRPRAFPGRLAPHPVTRTYPGTSLPFGPPESGAARLRHRRAPYVVAGVFSVLVGGIGGASFLVGGGETAPTPHVTPQTDMFTVEHSVTTGEVPFTDPAASYVPSFAGAPAGVAPSSGAGRSSGVGPSQLP